MINLNKGTKEFIAVDVVDIVGTLTTLVGTNTTYSTRKDDVEPDDWEDQDLSANVADMTAFCFIDTTQSGKYPVGKYELFVKFNELPSIPILGPIRFSVID